MRTRPQQECGQGSQQPPGQSRRAGFEALDLLPDAGGAFEQGLDRLERPERGALERVDALALARQAPIEPAVEKAPADAAARDDQEAGQGDRRIRGFDAEVGVIEDHGRREHPEHEMQLEPVPKRSDVAQCHDALANRIGDQDDHHPEAEDPEAVAEARGRAQVELVGHQGAEHDRCEGNEAGDRMRAQPAESVAGLRARRFVTPRAGERRGISSRCFAERDRLHRRLPRSARRLLHRSHRHRGRDPVINALGAYYQFIRSVVAPITLSPVFIAEFRDRRE
ncbi:MAG: hypothetical protein R3F21_24695 [Myxococcota bacterium]